jgi:hypothetical protein
VLPKFCGDKMDLCGEYAPYDLNESGEPRRKRELSR